MFIIFSTGRYGNMGRIRKNWKDKVDKGEMVRKNTSTFNRMNDEKKWLVNAF